MRRVTRRRFLQVSGIAATAAQTGGIATILTSSRAPAYGQQTSLNWLRWNDFVPASDQLLRQKTAQCEKDLGIKLNIETINANDIQARITSATVVPSGRRSSAMTWACFEGWGSWGSDPFGRDTGRLTRAMRSAVGPLALRGADLRAALRGCGPELLILAACCDCFMISTSSGIAAPAGAVTTASPARRCRLGL